MSICKFCGRQISDRSPGPHYYNNKSCFEKYKEEKRKEREFEEKRDNLIECKICKKKFKSLTSHIVSIHKISCEEYKKKYGNKVISNYQEAFWKDFWKGKNLGIDNGMYGKKPWNKDENRKEEIKEKLGRHSRGKKLEQIISNSEEVKEKMAAAKRGIFGKDANAYGPHNVSKIGKKRMREGYSKSLLALVKKEKVSKFEEELMLYISTLTTNLETQKQIRYYIVDGFLSNKNIVIEADGDYWRAGIHNLIEQKELNNQQKHTYRNDKRKTKYLLKHNYTIIRILQSEFEKHKEKGDTKYWLRNLLALNK